MEVVCKRKKSYVLSAGVVLLLVEVLLREVSRTAAPRPTTTSTSTTCRN